MRKLFQSFGILVLVGVHLWSVALAFTVNGFGIVGWVTASLSLTLPFVAELGWGIWAFRNDNPYFWGALAFFVLVPLLLKLGGAEVDNDSD